MALRIVHSEGRVEGREGDEKEPRRTVKGKEMWVIALGCDKPEHCHIVTDSPCHEIRDPFPVWRRVLFVWTQ